VTRWSSGRGGGFFLVLLVLPLFGLQHWVLNLFVFVLMYAIMASAWNLVGGFAGYPSLGHAAFFGIGAYSMALMFHSRLLTNGYEPFLFLPVIALIAGVFGIPIARISRCGF
jgi:branched-chain amino acid transport system permease protein